MRRPASIPGVFSGVFTRRAHDCCQGRREARRANPWSVLFSFSRPEGGRITTSAWGALLLLTLIAATTGLIHSPQHQPAPRTQPTHFEAIDLFVTPSAPLAAYQIEFSATAGQIKIVGIEGGDAPFNNAPYYDPAAMQHERVIIGALSTLKPDSLPTTKTRIARIHIMVAGDEPQYQLRLQTAAGPDARKIDAAASFQPSALPGGQGEGS